MAQPLAWGLIEDADSPFRDAFRDQLRLQVVLAANNLGFTLAQAWFAKDSVEADQAVKQLRAGLALDQAREMSAALFVLGAALWWPTANVAADDLRLRLYVVGADGKVVASDEPRRRRTSRGDDSAV